MEVTVHVLRTPEAQRLGVIPYQDSRTGRLPRNTMWFFPHITPSGFVSMAGVHEGLVAAFFNQNFDQSEMFTLYPDETQLVPTAARHLLEFPVMLLPVNPKDAICIKASTLKKILESMNNAPQGDYSVTVQL